MFEAIANFAIFATALVIVIMWLVALWKSDFGREFLDKPPCDMDCESCPFPPCSKERKERWKRYNDIHNGRLPR